MSWLDKIKGALGGDAEPKLARQLLQELGQRERYWGEVDLKASETGRQTLNLTREDQLKVVLALIEELRRYPDRFMQTGGKRNEWLIAAGALRALLRRQMPFAEADLLKLLNWLNASREIWSHWHPLSGTTAALESYIKASEPTPALKAAATALCEKLSHASGDADSRKYAARIAEVMGAAAIPLVDGDIWVEQARADLETLPTSQRDAWAALLNHCQSASGSKPTQKWLKRLEEWFPDLIAWDQFRDLLMKWFPLVDKPSEEHREVGNGHYRWRLHPMQMQEQNQDILKGLVWCCGWRHDPLLARALSALCISAFRKLPGIGPRATRLGNACLHTLGEMDSGDALAQLALLKVKIKNRSTQNQIAKALQAAAERQGVTTEELEEMSTPHYGLTDVGLMLEPLGDCTARLEITGPHATVLTWLNTGGKSQKSVPAALKADYAEDIKEIQTSAKDIQKMLPVLRERLDGLYLQQKTWSYGDWCLRYHEHPLVGYLARRLIWSFGREGDWKEAIHHEGRFVDAAGREMAIASGDEDLLVRLWHPLDGETREVLAWRNWLEEHLVTQPFKQAHREVYLLTAAEEGTGTYSNRYAAHILKQHQFNALCLARGWRNKLRLMVDDSYPPASRELAAWGIRAEFWIEGIGTDYGADTNESGTYLYLSTDQVRFYPLGAAQMQAHAGGGGYGRMWNADEDSPMDLREVPRLVFSEIMRDVDLFVGVASVGNDPNWSDGGPEGRHQHYWQSFAFGELNATANTRKDLLTRLLPRLKIRDKARIEGKFLVVEGSIRTYKIHLGSGNILMEPNDQYLCIVPNAADRKNSDKVFLPFEGDGVMAIVLSKAFLLADDDKIKDPSILSQIRRR